MVEQSRSGRSPEELVKELEPSSLAIWTWVRQAGLDGVRREDGRTSVEREDLRPLRREYKRLEPEHETLGRAAAWVARETDAIPPKDSNS